MCYNGVRQKFILRVGVRDEHDDCNRFENLKTEISPEGAC